MGKHCCVVGCFVTSVKCRGLSFHKLPRKGISSQQDEWRNALLQKISRDKEFNVATALICSRHFKEDCFESYGCKRKLKMGAMPMYYMPEKTIVTPKPLPRKEPRVREPPPSKEKVCYYNLAEVSKQAKQMLPWVLLEDSASCCSLGLLQHDMLQIKVSVSNLLKTTVHIKGKQLQFDESAVEKQGLKKVLSSLQLKKICQAITYEQIEHVPSCLAKIECEIVRELTTTCINQKYTTISTVRSVKCLLLIDIGTICEVCRKLEVKLKKDKPNTTQTVPVHPFTPLCTLNREQLADELKVTRRQKKKLETELAKIQTQLNNNCVREYFKPQKATNPN